MWLFPKRNPEDTNETNAVDVYLKFTYALANDPGITMIISRCAPDLVATPLTAHVKNQVMLLKDFGGLEVGSVDIVDPGQKFNLMSNLRMLHCLTGELLDELM